MVKTESKDAAFLCPYASLSTEAAYVHPGVRHARLHTHKHMLGIRLMVGHDYFEGLFQPR